MDRLEVVQPLAVNDMDAVPPDGDFIEVRAAPGEVSGDLHDLGRRLDAISARDERDTWESLPNVQDLTRVRGLLQVDGQVVQMHDRRWHLDRNRVNVEVREDAMNVVSMM